MLTKRQIIILTYLINSNNYITSHELSDKLKLHKKTIQQDIKFIITTLKDKCIIHSSKNKGYFLEYIDSDIKQVIRDSIADHEIYYSMKMRSSSICLYLLFSDKYTSMQQLADVFYLSKTAIALEMDIIKRWMKRNKGMKLEISNIYGFKIIAEENKKRIFCAKIGTSHVVHQAGFDDEMVQDYDVYLKKIKKVTQGILVSHCFMLSGEAYHKVCRYITLSIIRSNRGNRVENRGKEIKIEKVIRDLACSIEKEIDYSFKDEELYALQEFIYEEHILNKRQLKDDKIDHKLSLLEADMIDFLKLPCKKLFKEKDNLILHIQQLLHRNRSDHVAVNYLNEKIIINYPLESYLICKIFPKVFQIKPQMMELSFLTLYLANALEQFKDKFSVLLVTNQNNSVIENIKINLQKYGGYTIDVFDIEPVYLFEMHEHQIKQYDLYLTTEQDILFSKPPFYYIDSILGFSNIQEFSRLIQEVFYLTQLQKQDSIELQYVSVPKKIKTWIMDQTSSCFVVSDELLYICKIEENLETNISIFNLDQVFIYANKKIQKVIVSQFNPCQQDIFNFFRVVSKVLEKYS